jgi:hypothetical protein
MLPIKNVTTITSSHQMRMATGGLVVTISPVKTGTVE